MTAARRPIGLCVPNNEPGGARSLDRLPLRAEEMGFESVWFTDHVVGVRAMEGVYGSYWLDPLIAMTWVAARTSTIRLGTGVLVVPMRDAVLTAKMVATIDVFSNGRVDLGIGTGWSRSEFRAVGAAARFDARGKVTNEALEVFRACWSGGEVEYHGEFFDFRHVEFEPTPAQRPLPIWVGGNVGPALRRAARYGDVWHPHDISVEEMTAGSARIDELAGRHVPTSMRLAIEESDLDGLADRVDGYLAAGCSTVVLDFRSAGVEQVSKLAERAAALLL
ncbi:LLM class oxidoreductase [Jatrophihabitans fulvus]